MLLADPKVLDVLRKLVARRIPEREQEDFLQDCCLAALEAKDSPNSLVLCGVWLRRLVRNRAVSFYRQRFPEFDETEIDTLPASEPAEDDGDRLAWVQREIDEGRLDQETVEWMVRQAEGELVKDLGTDAGVKATKIRQRLFYRRLQLRRRWKEVEEKKEESTEGVLTRRGRKATL